MEHHHLLEGLNPAQREAVTSEAAPLCIVAGAGSGKTRVLTRRIAWRVRSGTADAPHVLALTFTRKAAGELRQRLGALGVEQRVVAGTFHAVAAAQLRRRWADRGEREPGLVQTKLPLLLPLLGRHTRSATLQPADVAAEIEWAKARCIPPSQYEVEAAHAGRTPPLPAASMAAVYQRYEAEKRRRGVVDFDDLLLLCAGALESDADFAATQRWRFRHLFVDEFQDVNPAQYRLLRGWLGDRADLCVVGDPNQAIYSWNGADPRLLGSFDRLFPGGATVRLDHNYRSSPQILAVAGAVLGAAPGAVEAHEPDGPLPTVQAYESDVAEARGVAARLRRAHRPGMAWSHLAILVRTNAQAVVFEEALGRAGIPYRVRGEGAFLSRPEIKEAVAALRRAPAAVPFAEALADVAVSGGSEPGGTEPGGTEPGGTEQGGTEPGGTAERRASLAQLVRLGAEYAELDPAPSVAGFTSWLAATVRHDQPDDGGDAVEIVTFHRAKGLEWPVVFVAGLEQGLVPIGHAGSDEEVAEERRLLYVALTRARQELHCSWAQRRTFGARSVARNRSPWLDAVEAATAAVAEGGPTADWRAHLAYQRARLGPAATTGSPVRRGPGAKADPAALAALKEWRAHTARQANVPAYVIFHDATLAAVAEARPGDRAGLLAIPGLGPVKAERYGDAILAVLAACPRPA